jgi:sorbitol-specific phosphotransferase system component IIC
MALDPDSWPDACGRFVEKFCMYGDALLFPALLALPTLLHRTEGLMSGMALVIALLWGKRRVRRVRQARAGMRLYRYGTWRLLSFFFWAMAAGLVLMLKAKMG